MDIKQEILHWIKSFVETPHPMWGDLPPCPYARSARINGELDIQVQDDSSYYDFLDQQIETFYETEFDTRLVVAKNKDDIDIETYRNYIHEKNKHVIEFNLILLTDHPDVSEYNHGVNVQQGSYVITFIQRTNKLLDASKKLHINTDYYNGWDENIYKTVVLDRFDKTETYINGLIDGPIIIHDKPTWMKQKK